MQKNVGQSSLSETNILPSLSLSLSFLEGFASTNKNIKGKNVKCIFFHAVFYFRLKIENGNGNVIFSKCHDTILNLPAASNIVRNPIIRTPLIQTLEPKPSYLNPLIRTIEPN